MEMVFFKDEKSSIIKEDCFDSSVNFGGDSEVITVAGRQKKWIIIIIIYIWIWAKE